MSLKYLEILADYGPVGDMAFAEVEQQLKSLLHNHDQSGPAVDITCHSAPRFDTTATGFYLAQLALNSTLGDQQFFYVNTAPRKDDKAPRKDSAGEKLVYVELQNGIRMVAVNSGYSLSFIKPAAETIRVIHCANKGSQFRSRDIYPVAAVDIIHGDDTLLGDDIMDHIPDAPVNHIGYIDGYGNIKTTIPAREINDFTDKFVRVSLNNITRKAYCADGIFSVSDGDLTFSPGSSGWTLPDGDQYRFVELVLRGGSAAELYDHPKAGQLIHLQATEDDQNDEDKDKTDKAA